MGLESLISSPSVRANAGRPHTPEFLGPVRDMIRKARLDEINRDEMSLFIWGLLDDASVRSCFTDKRVLRQINRSSERASVLLLEGTGRPAKKVFLGRPLAGRGLLLIRNFLGTRKCLPFLRLAGAWFADTGTCRDSIGRWKKPA